MARRKSSRRGKTQPSVLTLNMPLPYNDGNKNHYIDISQVASLVNRRFYRQGLQWAVAGFTLHTTATSGECHIFKVPQNWITSNSWEKSFRVWKKMIDDSTSETQSIQPRFMDFKIFADYMHQNLGVNSNMLPAAKNSFNN